MSAPHPRGAARLLLTLAVSWLAGCGESAPPPPPATESKPPPPAGPGIKPIPAGVDSRANPQ